jgi:uncharacterized 2Fe-2S/4Fe-4S cluster protein (DUF4445 family)
MHFSTMAITLIINGKSTEANAGLSLFDQAEAMGIDVPTSCRKQGKCKECMVEVVEGMSALSPMTEAECHLKGNFRLSCQTFVTGPAGGVSSGQISSGQSQAVKSAATPCAAGTCVSSARRADCPEAVRRSQLDPAVTRDGDRILIDGVEVERSTGPIHGIAMDLGTTTVVVRLMDLESGELIADTSFENPQRFGGSEIMSRIAYDTSHPGRLLMRTLAGYLSHAIEKFPIDPKTIYEMVVVGNSTMRDLFFRQNVYSIGQTPYRSITEIELAEGKRITTSLVESGLRSLLPIHPKARVYGAPIISGHVGADAAACMLAADLAHEERLVAIMDIGTNTELVVGNKDRILAASCPAGPAFEGGAIACGMPALDGAIEEVAIGEDGKFQIRVIGDGSPEGICGSGLVDLLSELLRTGRMNERGRFDDDVDRIDLSHGENGDVYLLESDVNELAQAKGANVAGLQVVFSTYGIDFDDVDMFYLAGGFGRHINVEASKRIGLVPNLAPEKFVRAGNLAIEGATIALLSKAKRQELEELVKKVQHCRLETHPNFFDFFVEGCQFKAVEPISCAR